MGMTEKDTKWVRLHLILSSCCPNRQLVSVQSAALFCHSAIASWSVDVDSLFTVLQLIHLSRSLISHFKASSVRQLVFYLILPSWFHVLTDLSLFQVFDLFHFHVFEPFFSVFMSLFQVLHGLMSSIRVSQFHVFEPPVPSSCL